MFDGYEIIFVINYFGYYFFLCFFLFDLVEGGCVIIVVSGVYDLEVRFGMLYFVYIMVDVVVYDFKFG